MAINRTNVFKEIHILFNDDGTVRVATAVRQITATDTVDGQVMHGTRTVEFIPNGAPVQNLKSSANDVFQSLGN